MKNKVDIEVSSFVEQMLDKFEKRIKIRGTFLEKPYIISLRNIYLQLKYISEVDKSIICAKQFNRKQHELVYRQAENVKKIMFLPFANAQGLKSNASFAWGKYKCDFSADEYIDIILSCLSSLFESYSGLFKNKNLFDCIKLAGALKLKIDTSKIDNAGNLEKLYAQLEEKTRKRYKQKTKSFYSMEAYRVRCSCFHMDYDYEPLPPSNFAIILADGSKICFDELLTLTLEIIANMNILMLVPYYFSISALPVKVGGKV